MGAGEGPQTEWAAEETKGLEPAKEEVVEGGLISPSPFIGP